MSLQKTIIYNDSTDLINGNLILHNKDLGTLNPSVGTVYLYLKNNVLNVRKNGQIDVDLESGGGGSDPLLLSNGSAAAPTYSFAGSASTGMFRKGTGELALSVSGTSIIDVSSATVSVNRGLSLSSASDITVNTDKFVVNAATGNTSTKGTLDVSGAVTTSGPVQTNTGSNRNTNEYTISGNVPADALTPFVTVASLIIASGDGCFVVTEAIAKTATTNAMEPLKTMRSVVNNGGVITETPHIDEIISDSWRYSTAVPGSYTLQLKANDTNTKYYTYRICIYQTNNSNVSL